jgi:hypothetical protein
MPRITRMDDDAPTRDPVGMKRHPDRMSLPVSGLSTAGRFAFACKLALCRLVSWEIAVMTKFTTDLSRQPANVTDMTQEDRVTYRRWAYGWFIAYSVLLGSMVIFSVATRPERRTMEASRTIGVEPMADTTASIAVSTRKQHPR